MSEPADDDPGGPIREALARLRSSMGSPAPTYDELSDRDKHRAGWRIGNQHNQPRDFREELRRQGPREVDDE